MIFTVEQYYQISEKYAAVFPGRKDYIASERKIIDSLGLKTLECLNELNYEKKFAADKVGGCEVIKVVPKEDFVIGVINDVTVLYFYKKELIFHAVLINECDFIICNKEGIGAMNTGEKCIVQKRFSGLGGRDPHMLESWEFGEMKR